MNVEQQKAAALELDLTESELDETLSLLRSTMERASELTRRAAQLASSAVPQDDGGMHAMTLRLRMLERERRAMVELLTESERHRVQLIGSYVATYQLHSTLDPAEVQATLGEIVTHVIGAESFALLLRSDGGDGLKIVLAQGGAEVLLGVQAGGLYTGRDPLIDGAIAKGELLIGPMTGSAALAAVPLTSQGALVGVLVLARLLEQRAPLGQEDRELLELIGAHAASALLAARAFAASERKRRTLQGLMDLARGH